MWKKRLKFDSPFATHLSLRALMMVSFGALFVSVLILMIIERTLGLPFTSDTGAYGSACEEASKRLELLADLEKERLQLWIAERKRHAASLSQTVLISRGLAEIEKALQRTVDGEATRAALQGSLKREGVYRDLIDHLKMVKQIHQAYKSLLLVDTQSGTVVASADENHLGANLRSNPIFAQAKQVSAQPIVTVGKLLSDQRPHMIVVAAAQARERESVPVRSAVLLLSVDTDAFPRALTRPEAGLGTKDEITLLGQDNRPLWHVGRLDTLGVVQPETGTSLSGRPEQSAIPFTSAYYQCSALAAYRNIEIAPGNTWQMIVKRDKAEALAPLWRRTLYSTLICLAAIVAGGFLAAIIARKIARPIKDLSKTAMEVKAGNLAARANETGSTEVAALAATFNSMIDRIQNWNRELEDQINSRTAVLRELNKNLLEEAAAHERTEKALRESQTSLVAAQKIAHLGSWDWNIITNELRWSEEIYRIFGISEDQFGATYDSFIECVHPDDREFVKKSVLDALENGSSYSIDHRIVRSGEEVRLVHEQGQVSFDESGKPIRMFGIVHDITERKRFEDQLRESEAFNKAVLNSLAAHICVIDANGEVIAVNEAWENFARTNGGEAFVAKTGVGTNYIEVCRSAEGESAGQALEALKGIEEVKKGARRLFAMEYPCHSPTESRWFSMTVSPLPGERGGLAISHWDITNRKLAEEKFLLLSAMVEQSSEGMSLRDLKGQLLFVNKALARMHGYSEEELVGKHYSILHTPDQIPAATKAWDKLESEGVFEGEIWQARRDGTAFPTMAHCSNLLDKKGNPKAIISAMHDISGLKKAELALRSSNALLQALSDAQAHFISSMNEQDVFEGLLKSLLVLAESEYGFIGETVKDEHNGPYLKTLAFTPMRWSEDNLVLHQKHADQEFSMHNLENLIGSVIASGKPVISNDVENDSRAGGLPPGHPPIHSFMGLPYKVGAKLTGMIGVANRPGGYTDEQVDFLQPYLVTCAQILEACRRDKLRKDAELALQKNEALLLNVLDALPVGVFFTDSRGCLVMANPAGKRIWKGIRYVGPEDYGVYKGWWASTGQKIEPHEWAAVGAVTKGETSLNQEIEIECFDGSRKTILNSAVPIRGENGGIAGAIVVNQDITDRVEGEMALKASEERMRLLIESAPIGIRFSQKREVRLC